MREAHAFYSDFIPASSTVFFLLNSEIASQVPEPHSITMAGTHPPERRTRLFQSHQHLDNDEKRSLLTWEETLSAIGFSFPPIVIHSVDICHSISLSKRELIILRRVITFERNQLSVLHRLGTCQLTRNWQS